MTRPVGKCFECDAATTMLHHVVPQSRGGKRALYLCEACHARAHGDAPGTVFRTDLIREGIKRRRDKGLRFGAPCKVTVMIEARIMELRRQGTSFQSIAKALGLSVGTVHATYNRLAEGGSAPRDSDSSQQQVLHVASAVDLKTT